MASPNLLSATKLHSSVIDLDELPCVTIPCVGILHRLLAFARDGAPAMSVACKNIPQHRNQSFQIARRHKDAVFAILDELRRPLSHNAHCQQPHRHRFEIGDAESLAIRGQDKYVVLCKMVEYLRMTDRPDERHLVDQS